MPEFTLGAITQALAGELSGDESLRIERVREVVEAGKGDITVVIDRRYLRRLDELPAAAVVVAAGVEAQRSNVVRVANPKRALVTLLRLFHPATVRPATIEPGAQVSPKAQLGRSVFVGAGATIEAGAVIGDGCQVHGGAFVGEEVVLGEGCEIFPNVTLYPRIRLGRRVRVHGGTVIGSDGFGYFRDESGVQEKIPQVGSVEIGDDVEIGANCAVDRATMGATRIGRGSKIDNLVQIGHNCEIGEHCCIIGLVGLSGSVKIGDYCVLAGQAGIADHVTLADHVVVGAQAGVHRDLGPGNWLGSPAIPAEEAYRVYTTLSRLPEMRRTLRSLEERIALLEAELAHLRGSAATPK